MLNKVSEKGKIDKIVNNVVLQILQITHLPGHLERPEYECRPPCSTPQKQKVIEYVSGEGYSGVSDTTGLGPARLAVGACRVVAQVCWSTCCRVYSVALGVVSFILFSLYIYLMVQIESAQIKKTFSLVSELCSIVMFSLHSVHYTLNVTYPV